MSNVNENGNVSFKGYEQKNYYHAFGNSQMRDNYFFVGGRKAISKHFKSFKWPPPEFFFNVRLKC